MGNGGAKKTNQMLGAQTDLANRQAGVMGDRSASEYDWRTGARQTLWDQYASRLGDAPTVTGGSASWTGPAFEFYKNMMETGGMTPLQQQEFKANANAPIAGFYTGMKNEMARRNASLGGYAGYNSQNAKLTRDAAREGYNTAYGTEIGLNNLLNQNKFQGAAGAESSYHRGSAGSAGGVGSQDYYLRAMEGLMNGAEDLPYAQLNQSGLNLGTGTINARKDETPLWQKTLMSMAPAAASAAMGAFGGGGGPKADPYGASSTGSRW